ncbi:MAG: NAD(P)-dependent oxidoreductase [Planctomycetota bacterium]|jgi:nucleoside-diphosphate-sugar epimerase|nr:NAD(P)-dependent oxidoreductase [Planctomycetota bacterium]MDP6762295.1 NAD(P)-dependent oxidoreductase [Planctomycetota bacterium]MDP6990317.1 NAD(P)-dependent oxidoreductase [Planctomycetota bacterium]
MVESEHEAAPPEVIETVEDLEECLSRPTAAVVEDLGTLDGDLVVLGAGGKMGPSLARMARRALDASGSSRGVIAVSRFSDGSVRARLEAAGVRTHVADLLDPAAVGSLPPAGALLFLVGAKFGTTADAARTWAVNEALPRTVAARYAGTPTVVFSSGNVYPFVSADGRGADERTPPAPVGEYARSVLARERAFADASAARGTPVLLYRLNYAVELRYGVLVDVARRVLAGEPVELSMGRLNAIWQGDACAVALRCLARCASPPAILNVTGPESLSVRELAERFGAHFGREPLFAGEEQPTALLSDASEAVARLGPPRVGIERVIDWTAAWLSAGAETWEKPTGFERRDGAF